MLFIADKIWCVLRRFFRCAVVSAVKHCEDDDGIIIRIVNYVADENASLNLYDKDYNISIGKREIKTLKYKENALTEVNMLEK